MIIGIDASRAFSSHKTGVEWYAYHIIMALRNIIPSSHTVRLYVTHPVPTDVASFPSNWEIHVLSWPPKRCWTHCRLSIELLLHPVDVLWIPAHVPPIYHPRRTIMTVHDVAAAVFPESYSWFEGWYSLWSVRHAVQSLSDIIVPSDWTKQEIEQHISSKVTARTHVIPHGIDDSYRQYISQDSDQELLASYGIHGPYMIAVGRLETKKNTVRIIEAFTLIKSRISCPHQLVLVGKPGYGYDDVRAAITLSPYSQDIICLGWVEQSHMPLLMAHASGLVFTSVYEGFGLPILEAFMVRTPVITSQTTSTKEIAGDAALLVDPLDIEAIASAMQQLIEHTDTGMDLVDKGYRRAALYSWQIAAKKTAAVLCNDFFISG